MLTSVILLLSDFGRRESNPVSIEQGGNLTNKKWNLHLIKYLESPSSEQSEAGVYLGIKESGLLEDRDYELKTTSAQGDMATLPMLVDGAITDQADLIITLSTPTLQTVVNRVKNIPVVFTHVANPIVAGAGESNDNHLSNITGAYNLSDYDGLLQIIKQCIPGIRRIGTLFSPSETNSVFHKDNLIQAGFNQGLDVIAIGVITSVEVTDGAMSLCSQGIDAICQIADNLCDGSFITIANVAQKSGVPISGFSSHCVEEGAFLVLARDFEDTGREAGFMVSRVIRGENPATIPFQTISTSKLILNIDAAEQFQIDIPQSVLEKADRIIDTP